MAAVLGDADFVLSGAVTVTTVPGLLNACLPAIQQGAKIIDFAGATELDSAALALILACQREAARLNATLRCVNLPANLISLATLYGVSEFIVQ
jgi:phospholipid transport system transporter-binding protein